MTPLERAVEALKDKIGGEPWHDGQWLIDGPFPQSDLVEAVRAVLTAIREPEESMIDAARVEAEAAGTVIRQHEIEGIFRAMIDAMLAEGTTD